MLTAALCFVSGAFATVAEVTPAQAEIPGMTTYRTVTMANGQVETPADEPPQMPGWPRTTGSHVNFAPARGVVFADLDGDGKKEILAPSTEGKLFAWKLDGSLAAGFPVSTIGFPQYPPSVGDLDGDGNVEIVQTTRGFTNGGRLYVFNKNGQVLSGWPKSIGNNNVEYSATLADLDRDNHLEIIVGERAYPIGRLHVFEKDGSEWGGNWPVTIDHVPTMTASVGDVDRDGELEIFYPSYNSMYLIRRDGSLMPGWPKAIPNANFSYQSAALADLDGDLDLEIVVGCHGSKPGIHAFRYDGTTMPGWPKSFQTWTYCPPTVTDLEGNGVLDIISGQAGSFSPPSNMFWVWNPQGQVRSGFPLVSDHGGGSEGPLTTADVDGDGIHEIFADHNMMVSDQGFFYGIDANGQALPGFPTRTDGFTYLNGGTIGDVDGDGDYELGVIASRVDLQTITIYLYTLPSKYRATGREWPTYHARNTRGGQYFIAEQAVAPTNFQIVRGVLVFGDLNSLIADDNNSLVVRNGIVFQNDYPVNIEFTSQSPSSNPTTLDFDIRFLASSPGVRYVVDLFDYDAGAWDTSDAITGLAPTSEDHLSINSTNPGRYVEAGTNRVRARIRAKWNAIALSGSFAIHTDLVRWRMRN
ncbi:MAG: hypothetical protein HONBIEJF_01474 [Fimbriimonadaceae bacterium]|nr:hypothetical protein [Fimbriimonadaceae bacterium]